MLLKLPLEIKDLPIYPKGRQFTSFEACMDLLLAGPNGTGVENPRYWAERWQWEESNVIAFLAQAPKRDKTFYEIEDSAAQRKAMAQEIIDLFNVVFDRKIQLNDHRLKTIYGRIKEGRKLTPPVGRQQFKAVFEHQKDEWTGTDQEKFLTIETLCAARHFMKYLDAAREAYKKKLIKATTPSPSQEEGVKLSGSLFKTNGAQK